MLGRNHGDSVHGNLWSCSKFLDFCPVGTVVRNGCDHRAPAGEGTHLIKVLIDPTLGAEWVPYNPRTQSWRKPDQPWISIRGRDIYLPVQVVIRGKDEQ